MINEINSAGLPTAGYVREKHLINQPARGDRPERQGVVGVSHATLWRWIKSDKFPQPVKLSEGVTAWPVEQVREWLAKRAA